MKTLICLTLVVSALASPALTFAQATSGQLTRAQVRADLIRVEQAGYNPSAGDDQDYPADIQAAEAKIAEQDGARLAADAVGGTAQAGSSQTGMAANAISPVPCMPGIDNVSVH
ncbi:DUF4148 domain-containing protein [Paraburkholderia sp. SIMBA_030]|uniref:DUF4148 domain-containing protein n=1 Tax=Paraburkholderia sp. SIMBA_030 TaxID=3085773 RepID=UPI00397BD933